MRLETGAGPVEIAFGRLEGQGTHVLERLRAAGWKCDETDARGASVAIARIISRKEASIVILQKTEGRFLSVRRTVP